MQLKMKWVCERHQGEHGEPGYCYVDDAGVHLGLNSRKLKIWAAAIVCYPLPSALLWTDTLFRLLPMRRNISRLRLLTLTACATAA